MGQPGEFMSNVITLLTILTPSPAWNPRFGNYIASHVLSLSRALSFLSQMCKVEQKRLREPRKLGAVTSHWRSCRYNVRGSRVVRGTAKAWSLPAPISFWGGKYKFKRPASSWYSHLVGTVCKFPPSTRIWCKQRNSRLIWSFNSKDVFFLISNNKTPQWYEVFFSLCQQRLLYMTELSVRVQPEYSSDEVQGQVTNCI